MARPANIGIIALEAYIPSTYVSQVDLELFYKESQGKYTIGLGQQEMSCVGDREDINSISATVLLSLLEKHHISPMAIGRIEIGTETIQDKSKSTKTFLMQYLGENYNVEGVTSYNACYGGVQALFNTVAWIESSSWDGRLGVVIASDIAVYEQGPARATGGAGAIALLIGPNAKLVLCPERTSYLEHAYDFYKPMPSSEYPVVDGHFSVNCYLKAASICFKDMKKKLGITNLAGLGHYYCFHAPYFKMIVKAFSQIVTDDIKELYKVQGKTFDLKNKETVAEVNNTSKTLWQKKAEKASLIGKKVGNIYCGSLFLSLTSLLAYENVAKGKSIVMFAYGSGLAASMFRLVASEDIPQSQEILKQLQRRVKLTPEEYSRRMQDREKNYERKHFSPEDRVNELFPGSVYLERVDDRWRRFYSRVPRAPKL